MLARVITAAAQVPVDLLRLSEGLQLAWVGSCHSDTLMTVAVGNNPSTMNVSDQPQKRS